MISLCSCSTSGTEEKNELTTSDYVLVSIDKSKVKTTDFESGSEIETKYKITITGYCKKDIEEYRISISFLDRNGRIMTNDFVESKTNQMIKAGESFECSQTFENDYTIAMIEDVKITFWGIEYEENTKNNSNTAETIGTIAIGTIILIGFIAFFLWIGKENKEAEEEYNRLQDEAQQKENNNTEPNTQQKEAETTQNEQQGESSMPKVKYCPVCGAQNDIENNFCTSCGKQLNNIINDKTSGNETSVNPQVANQQTININTSGNRDIIVCPKCGSTNIHFVTTQASQNFDAGDACCGYALCGAPGLLCGVKHKTEAETVRKCMSCNHEF